MEFLCSNVHYFYYDTESFFRNSRAAGFYCAELYLGTPHIFIDGRTIDDFSGIPKLAEAYGVRIKAVHPETLSFRYGLCCLDRQWNQKSLEAYKRCIDYAAEIGADRLDTDLTGGFRDQDRERILQSSVESLRELIEYGREKHVSVALEAAESELQGFITGLEQMRQFDRLLSDDRLLIGVNREVMELAGETLKQWETAFGRQRIAYIRTDDPQKLAIEKMADEGFDGDVILFHAGDTYLEEPFALDRLAEKEVSRWG